ncbi:MAG: FHA domain-containing protein, partial [Oligoflexales bacterium]|nr:FHA domain-containing protein [Oligoflexales bacterium]
MSLEIRFTLPNQSPQVIALLSSRTLIGTLLSNEVVIRAPGVEPIHAMIEEHDDGKQFIVDLGSKAGVMVNGEKIDVEKEIKVGDAITIGDITLDVVAPGTQKASEILTSSTAIEDDSYDDDYEPSERTSPEAMTAPSHSLKGDKEVEDDVPKERVKTPPPRQGSSPQEKGRKKDVLFSPRDAKPSGDVLEVVSYWGDTILDVELFHPAYKGFEACTIGDPTKAHFLAGGESNISRHLFATLSDAGYTLRMLPDMEARIRKDGQVGSKKGEAKVSLGRRDIAHVLHGPISFFLMFIKPPDVVLPPNKARDPFFIALLSTSLLLYFITVPMLWMATPVKKVEREDDAWTLVNVPEKQKPEEKKPKKKEEPPKPKVEVAEKKTPPKPQPPKPQPPEVKPKKPEPPKQTPPTPKPAEPPKPQPKEEVKVAEKSKSTDSLPKDKPKVKDILNKLNEVGKAEGMASTGAKNPDFKLAGPKTDQAGLKTGGEKGSGMGQVGGGRKGNQKTSVMGVEGVNNNKASGVNLSKLGLGAGKILSNTGVGAIHTNFTNSAGGAGGGSGHMDKTYGFGGMGTGSSLGLAGSGTAVNNFGSGAGGEGSGQGGTGGLGGLG